MKDKSSIFVRLLPHCIVIMAFMLLTFLIINFFNPYMQFLDNIFAQILMIVFCVLAIVESFVLVVRLKKGR